MQPFSVREIERAVGGVWWNPREGAPEVSSVSTDSRNITPGCLFIPLSGEKFDGHRFIDAALDAGAAGQNIALAAHACGLGGCWLTFTSENMKQRIREFAGLPEHIRMTTYVDVGYPDQSPYPPQRISVDEAVFAWK